MLPASRSMVLLLVRPNDRANSVLIIEWLAPVSSTNRKGPAPFSVAEIMIRLFAESKGRVIESLSFDGAALKTEAEALAALNGSANRMKSTKN